MSSKNLEKVIQRAISDAAFRRQLQSNPAAALRGFKLTDDEVAALRSGDAGKLMSLGIDQRMSKAFDLGGTMSMNAASRAGTTELSVGGLAITDDAPRAATGIDSGALNTSNAAVDPGVIGDPRQISDNAAAAAAGRVGSLGTGGESVRSSVRDVEPANVGGTQVTDDGQLSMGDRVITSAGSDTIRSAVRDVGPTELRGATYSGDDTSGPGYLASDATTGSVSRIRDAEPFDTRGVADPTSELTARHMATGDNTVSELTAKHLAGTDATSVSQIRNTEPFDLRGAAADPTSELTARHLATGDQSAAAFHTSDDMAGSMNSVGVPSDAGTVASQIRNTEPFDTRGVADPTSELTARHIAAGDQTGVAYHTSDDMAGSMNSVGVPSDAGTVASQIRNTEPFDLRGAADPTSELTARHMATGDNTVSELTAQHLASTDASSVSRIRDAEPFDSRGVADPTSELTARHLDSSTAGGVSHVRDVAPVDLRGAVASTDATGTSGIADPDSAEAYSPSFHTGGQQDAFLSQAEATQYSGGAQLTEGFVDDTSAAISPDATTMLPEHQGGDAIGNTGSGNEPDITA